MKKVTKNIHSLIIVILSVFLVVLGVRVSSQSQEIKTIENSANELDVLLRGPGKVRGYSCGVLSESRAKELLISDSLKAQFGTAPSYKVQEFTPALDNMFWADSCRYEDKFNNSKYVELYINTFQSPEDAQNAFPDFARIVNDSEEVDPLSYGEKLLYDGGSYTLLRKDQIIQIAANNGNANTKEFSGLVLEELIESLN